LLGATTKERHMTSTFPVSFGERLQRGLLALLVWTPVLAPIMYLLNNSLMALLGFEHYSLLRTTFVSSWIVFFIHATCAAQITAEADNRVDRIIHDPALGFRAKISAISKDRLGGALTIYLFVFIAMVCTMRF
jgi:hypothetical protein